MSDMIPRMINEALAQLRNSIDAIDYEIITALAKRMTLVRDVGAIKREHGAPMFDEDRFRQLIADRTEAGERLSLPKDLVKDIFTRIHDMSVIEEENGSRV